MLLMLSNRFMYSLLLAIDANFKLKHKNRKFNDVPLADGFAYFVQSEAYMNHLSQHDDPKEVCLILHIKLYNKA
jgi:hypothetical protein